jgi:hypothetical protein
MHGFEKLELSTETIRELTGDELDLVAGGAQGPTVHQGCTTGVPTIGNCLTGIYPSINAPCDTSVLCK